MDDGMDEDGDELSKRPDNFGIPVNKSAYYLEPFGSEMRRKSYHLPVDDPNNPPVLICKMRKGQELKIRCIAKKVYTPASSPTGVIYMSLTMHRVSQKSTPSGRHAQLSPLSTIHTTDYDIHRTGLRRTSRPSGHSARMPRRSNQCEMMRSSITMQNRTSSIWMWRRMEA